MEPEPLDGRGDHVQDALLERVALEHRVVLAHQQEAVRFGIRAQHVGAGEVADEVPRLLFVLGGLRDKEVAVVAEGGLRDGALGREEAVVLEGQVGDLEVAEAGDLVLEHQRLAALEEILLLVLGVGAKGRRHLVFREQVRHELER